MGPLSIGCESSGCLIYSIFRIVGQGWQSVGTPQPAPQRPPFDGLTALSEVEGRRPKVTYAPEPPVAEGHGACTGLWRRSDSEARPPTPEGLRRARRELWPPGRAVPLVAFQLFRASSATDAPKDFTNVSELARWLIKLERHYSPGRAIRPPGQKS